MAGETPRPVEFSAPLPRTSGRIPPPSPPPSPPRAGDDSRTGSPSPGASRPYDQRPSKILGAPQMMIGVFCILSSISLHGQLGHTAGYGVLGGLTFFTSGLLMVLSGMGTQDKRLITSTMIVSVAAAAMCFPLVSLSVLDALHNLRLPTYSKQAIIVSVVTVVLTTLEASFAVATSVLCCSALCRAEPRQKTSGPEPSSGTRQFPDGAEISGPLLPALSSICSDADPEALVLPPTESTLPIRLQAQQIAEYSTRMADVSSALR